MDQYSDDDSSEGAEAMVTKTVVIDSEDDDDDMYENEGDRKSGVSLLNKDDFDDGGSTPASTPTNHEDEDSNSEHISENPDSADEDGDNSNTAKSESKVEDQEKRSGSIILDETVDKEAHDKIKEEQKHDSDDANTNALQVDSKFDNEGREWDFDVMMQKKKNVEKKRRYKGRGDSIILMSNAEELAKVLVERMAEAAEEDRISNEEKKPAIEKRKMLNFVRSTLLKADIFETLLDHGIMTRLCEWLSPLPDKTALLKILEGYPSLDQETLKQSGLGKAIMFLFKHAKETRENKAIAEKLIGEWKRSIFQLEVDHRALSRDERMQRDYNRMSTAKRLKLNIEADGVMRMPAILPEFTPNLDASKEKDVKDKSIPRARVPKPSTTDYVIRPLSLVEGRFRGTTRNRTAHRFEEVQRSFKERSKVQGTKIIAGVDLKGDKID